jgi:magnesium transporter
MPIIDGSQQLNINAIEHEGVTWYDLQRPGTVEMAYLRDNFPFHPLDLEDAVSRVQLPKLDRYPSYIFLVLHFPVFDHRSRLTRPSQVAVFAGASYVVTVHPGELRPLTKLLEDCQQSEEIRREHMSFGTGFMLYQVLARLVDYSMPILNKLIGQVDGLEAMLFDRKSRNLLQDLAFLRRDILSYRRIVRPQIPVIEALESQEFAFLEVSSDVYFGDLADKMRRIWVELEELKEVGEGLQDTHAQLTNQHTNEVIRLLTVFASIMLPLTVVTGFFGMNVALPLAGVSWAYGVILAAMVAISVALVLFLVRRRWT